MAWPWHGHGPAKIDGCWVWDMDRIVKLQNGVTRPGKRLHNELENHHPEWVNPLFLWAIFNSYVKLPEGNQSRDIFHGIFE